MNEFEKSVISLLKVIANGQLVQMNVTPQMVGRDHLVRQHADFARSVFESLQSIAESEHSLPQSSGVAQEYQRNTGSTGDGTGEQTGG
jgi:hypothetical protein